MKVLNLYAGIGGNRKLWEDVEVTAVEINPEIAQVYDDQFPEDELIIGDAHQYLLDHYKEFDFIWSSPPCPTHSKARFWGHKNTNPVYPDMKLYQEIILLKTHFDGKWIVENVKPYYTPLILPDVEIGRHLFWGNFRINNPTFFKEADIKHGKREEWQELHGISIDGYKFSTRTDKILRNCVHPETGLHILNAARNIITKSNTEQTTLF